MVSLILLQKFENMEKVSSMMGSRRASVAGKRTSTILSASFSKDKATKNSDKEIRILGYSVENFGNHKERKASLLTKPEEEGESREIQSDGTKSMTDLNSMPIVGKSSKENISKRYTKFVPELRIKDLGNMVPDERDEVID